MPQQFGAKKCQGERNRYDSKGIYDRSELVLGPRRFAPFVTKPYAPTPPPLSSACNHFSIFLSFLSKFAPQFFCKHDPTSNLAESRYPPLGLVCLFVCLFVCCHKTRKTLLRLPPWARSKTPGSISTRAA